MTLLIHIDAPRAKLVIHLRPRPGAAVACNARGRRGSRGLAAIADAVWCERPRRATNVPAKFSTAAQLDEMAVAVALTLNSTPSLASLVPRKKSATIPRSL